MKKSKLTLLPVILLILSTTTAMAANIPSQNSTSQTTFGITYLSTHWHYEEHYLTNEIIQKDFQLFCDNNIKSITLAINWNYTEPDLGNYNFQTLDDIKRVCKFAAEYNLSVIIDFHTIMQPSEGTSFSWTIPDWCTPRLFNTIFTNSTIRRAWLDFLGNCTNYLNDVKNINSWHMMNEPFLGTYFCPDASTDKFVQLWTEMRTTIKNQSEKPIAIRFSEYGFRSPLHFNYDPRIYQVCDYVALNYYEDEKYFSPQNLTTSVEQIRAHTKNVVISEFGYEINDDNLQQTKYQNMISLFQNLSLDTATAFYWRGDYNSTNPAPPSKGLNLAKTTNGGDPRPAFYELKTNPDPVQHNLHIATSGAGSVTKNPDLTSYPSGSEVQLTAIPSSGWSFQNWSGEASGNQSQIQLTMDRSKSVTATFTANPTSTPSSTSPLPSTPAPSTIQTQTPSPTPTPTASMIQTTAPSLPPTPTPSPTSNSTALPSATTTNPPKTLSSFTLSVFAIGAAIIAASIIYLFLKSQRPQKKLAVERIEFLSQQTFPNSFKQFFSRNRFNQIVICTIFSSFLPHLLR